MWICPVCKKENIDNAHLCLHCLNGKLCTRCKNAFAGDVCGNCGKGTAEKDWLTETEYASYISSMSATVSDSAQDSAMKETQEAPPEDESILESANTNSDETIKALDESAEEPEKVQEEATDSKLAEDSAHSKSQDALDNEALATQVTETIAKPNDNPVQQETAAPIEDALKPEAFAQEPSAENDFDSQTTEKDNSAPEAPKAEIPPMEEVPKDGGNAKNKNNIPKKEIHGKKEQRSARRRTRKKIKTWIPIILSLILVTLLSFALYYYIYLPGHPKQQSPAKEVPGTIENAMPTEVFENTDNDADSAADSNVDSSADDPNFGISIEYTEFEYMNKFLGIDYPASDEDLSTEESRKYSSASAKLMDGNYFEAYTGFRELGSYSNSKSRLTQISSQLSRYLSTGYNNTVALRRNGTVVATGNNDNGKSDVNNWINVTGVSTRGMHTVGVRYDGTVIASGSNEYGQCNVNEWYSVIDVKAGSTHTLGLTAKGTAVAVGNDASSQCNVYSWKNLRQIAAGAQHSVALKKDGTVVASGDNSYGQCDVSSWTDIVQISAGDWYTIGLKSDGTVVSAGYNGNGQCELSQWKDIVYVSAGMSHTVGIKSDGTVIAAGSNDYGECNVSQWRDIVAVSAGGNHFTTALTSDGKVLAIGNNTDGQCLASQWMGIAS